MDNQSATPRPAWDAASVLALFELPFPELLYRAQTVHREHFDPGVVQACTLLSVKTGACPEDCSYCSQSIRYDTGLERESLMDVDKVRESARRARDAGASRLCMGAAWRSPKERDLQVLEEMVRAVREEGLETCVSAGMLKEGQAERLAAAGLDYYNHNIDTSPEYYNEIITTRTFDDRIETLERVRESGVHVCCGGIIGMGEARSDRAEMLRTLANLPEPPRSVPVNQLVPIPGTPLGDLEPVEPMEMVRTIAVARILMPQSWVRLSAGREHMSDELQTLAFCAGANSIFYGEKLLTTSNPDENHDRALLERLGMRFQGVDENDVTRAEVSAPEAS